MKVKLTPKLQLGSNQETLRQKLEEAAQSCLDRLIAGADYVVWGTALRTIGTQWLASSGHDVVIF